MMVALDNNLYNEISSAFQEAVNKIKSEKSISISDLYVQVRYDDLMLSIFDDDENILVQATIDGWDSLKQDSDNFDQIVTNHLKHVLNSESLKHDLESIDMIYPFSIVLVDEKMEQITELLLLDDDTIMLDDKYWANLDKELDEFLEKLLSDMK